jgi:pimeloyl-ACP methyl ester carboxylesterase
MPTARVNGLNVAYELHGEGEPVAITCGGRFSMDAPGVRGLALALAEGGKRALIWDRPNTGASDISFDAEFESSLHADTLAGLIETLELGKTTIVGGSAGARVSLLTVVRHPEVAKGIAIWWIVGGYFGLASLSIYYYGDSWRAVKRQGMEGVAALPLWQETLEKNPANRERLLAMDPEEFAAKMEAWGPAFVPYPDSPVPGVRVDDYARIRVPALVFRSGSTDLSHQRRTSEWVHELIPSSLLVEPPWGDEEYNDRFAEFQETGENVLFRSWPMLAPQVLEFMNARVPLPDDAGLGAAGGGT